MTCMCGSIMGYRMSQMVFGCVKNDLLDQTACQIMYVVFMKITNNIHLHWRPNIKAKGLYFQTGTCDVNISSKASRKDSKQSMDVNIVNNYKEVLTFYFMNFWNSSRIECRTMLHQFRWSLQRRRYIPEPAVLCIWLLRTRSESLLLPNNWSNSRHLYRSHSLYCHTDHHHRLLQEIFGKADQKASTDENAYR